MKKIDNIIKFCETRNYQSGKVSDECLKQYMSELDSRISTMQFIRHEAGIPHNPFEWGYTLYSFIKAGDLENVKEYYCRDRSWIPGMPSDNLLRYRKNMAIMLISVVANFAAMDKIIDHEYCFTVSDACVQLIEEAKTSEEIHYVVFSGLCKYTMLVKQNGSETYHPLIQRTKDYINNHFHEKLTVQEIADSLSVSTEYLTRVFKKVLGCTVKDYVHKLRIRRMKQLLQFTDMPIADISRYMGYSSQSYMTDIFRKATGYTPKQYRSRFWDIS